MKNFFAFMFMLVFVIGLIAAVGFFLTFSIPPSVKEKQFEIVMIPAGATMKDVADLLHERNLIRHKVLFSLVARLRGADTQIKSGEYQLSNQMLPLQILGKLIRGEQVKYSVTVPEGFTLAQIAELYAAMKMADKETFIALANNPQFIATLGIEEETLEGRLFPDTYKFVRNISEEHIIRRMVRRFDALFSEKMKARAEALGFSVQEIITLASMIEKETADGTEKPLISAVFHNRLARKMRFQCDPTVIYGMNNFTGRLTKEDLGTYTPYNTYVIKGLPPSPISNPGLESIMAALYPADVDYLYFVSKNDGTHHFSKTLAEHNQAVSLYQSRKLEDSDFEDQGSASSQ